MLQKENKGALNTNKHIRVIVLHLRKMVSHCVRCLWSILKKQVITISILRYDMLPKFYRGPYCLIFSRTDDGVMSRKQTR